MGPKLLTTDTLPFIFRPSFGYLGPWNFLFNRPKYWLRGLLGPLPIPPSLEQTVVAGVHTLGPVGAVDHEGVSGAWWSWGIHTMPAQPLVEGRELREEE